MGRRGHKSIQHPAFTLYSSLTYYDTAGKILQKEQRARAVCSTGKWRVVTTKSDGTAGLEFFFEPGRGFFTVNRKNNTLKQDTSASTSLAPARTVEELRSDPNFLRIEYVLGMKAYVIRVMESGTTLPSMDVFYAEELGGSPLKVINYNNGQPSLVNEPIDVKFGEPDLSRCSGPDYPVQN
jgi:hypothetical protein